VGCPTHYLIFDSIILIPDPSRKFGASPRTSAAYSNKFEGEWKILIPQDEFSGIIMLFAIFYLYATFSNSVSLIEYNFYRCY
jgi:hypothetical protein